MKIRLAPNTDTVNVVLEIGARATATPQAAPVFHLKKILLPVDFSECSRKALRYAAGLAKQFSAEVLLLHIVEVKPMGPIESHDAAKRELLEWQNEFELPTAVHPLVREAFNPHQEIVKTALESGCDLIVVGNHGRGGFGLTGSTAEKIVRHAPCPVLVIREPEHDFLSEPESVENREPQAKEESYGHQTEQK